MDNVKNYLFALGFEEGDISVFDISKPGRENTAKEVAKLKNKPKVMIILTERAGKFVGQEKEARFMWVTLMELLQCGRLRRHLQYVIFIIIIK